MSVPHETDWLDLLAKNDRRLIDSADKCWPWRGAIQSKGYGALGRGVRAHRVVVYRLVHGAIPDGLTIDHLCRNRRCVNPAHLEAVPMQENYRRGDGQLGLAIRWTRGVSR